MSKRAVSVWCAWLCLIIGVSWLHSASAGIVSVRSQDVHIIRSGYNSTENLFAIDWINLASGKKWLGVSHAASKSVVVGKIATNLHKLSPRKISEPVPSLSNDCPSMSNLKYLGKSLKFRKFKGRLELMITVPVIPEYTNTSDKDKSYVGHLMYAQVDEVKETFNITNCKCRKLAGFSMDVEADSREDVIYNEKGKIFVVNGGNESMISKDTFAVALSRKLFASTMPKNIGGTGNVYLYNSTNFFKEAKGTQMGSYFGYSLAIGHVNSSSLIVAVGSPYWFDNESWIENVGAVDILACNHDNLKLSNDCLSNKSRISPPRPTPMGRFGSSLVFTDLNKDGYDDLIVSEPGYENAGALHVYLYEPQTGRLSDKPHQTITAAEFTTSTKPAHFGQAVATNVDFDENGFSDILTSINGGDSLSLAIFKTRPVVMLNASFSVISSSQNYIDHEREWNCSNLSFNIFGCLAIQVCMNYSSSKGGPLKLTVNLQLTADMELSVPRVTLVTSSKNTSTRLWQLGTRSINETFNLTKQVQSCAIWYTQSEFTDQQTEVTKGVVMSVQYSLAPNKSAKPTSLLPILVNQTNYNQYETIRQNLTLKFKNLCGEDQRCQIDMSADAAFPAGSFVLGTAQLQAVLIVANKLEPAYAARLYIGVPIGFTVTVLNEKEEALRCHPVGNDTEVWRKYDCDIGNPFFGSLQGDSQRSNASNQTYSVKFGVSDFKVPLRVSQDYVNVTFNVTSETDLSDESNANARNNYEELIIPLKYDLALSIEARSQPNQLYVSANDPLSAGEITFIYQMKSLRVAGVQQLRLNITSVSKTEKDVALIRSMRFEANGNQLKCSVEPVDKSGANSNSNSYTEAKTWTLKLFRHAVTSSLLWPFSAIWNPTVYTSEADLNCVDRNSPVQCVVHSCLYGLSTYEDVMILKAKVLFDLDAVLTVDQSSIAFFVTTRLDAQVTDVSYVLKSDFALLKQRISERNFSASASLRFPIMLKVETQKETPAWVIAAASGTAVFVVIIVLALLGYAGFFERKRPRKAATAINDATRRSGGDYTKPKCKTDEASAE